MIIRPKTDTPKLGRKNIDAASIDEAIAIYRKRFGALADSVELIAEGQDDGSDNRPDVAGVVESDSSPEPVSPGGPSDDGD